MTKAIADPATIHGVPDLLRVALIILGGTVAGSGTLTLMARRDFYHRYDFPLLGRAMMALCIVNWLVMAFLASVLVDRWSEPISWRLVLVAAIIVSKGVFFHFLRIGAMDHEDRLIKAGRVI